VRVARRVRRGDRGKRTVATPEPRPRSYPMLLLITRVAAWLRLSRREERWKTAEALAAAGSARSEKGGKEPNVIDLAPPPPTTPGPSSCQRQQAR
jgi:hypothetical protein